MVLPKELRVRSGTIELAVRLWDNPGRPTLVLVHGYPDNQLIWDAVVQHLAEDYCVLTYDVRGAGASDIPRQRSDYKLDQLSADLKAITDSLAPRQPFHLVAHDWGSIQSWESVTDPSMQPRIASYTTLSGPCLDHAGHWIRQRLRRPSPRHLGQLVSQLFHSWYIYLFHLPWLMPMLWRRLIGRRWSQLMRRIEHVEIAASPTQASDGEHGIKLYRANIFQRLFSPRQRHTSVPVLAIVPRQDHYVRPYFTDDLWQWAPRLWRRDVDVGHWDMLYRQPQLLARYISEFVESIETGVEPASLRQCRVSGQ